MTFQKHLQLHPFYSLEGRRAFTLTETLVVMAIVLILASLSLAGLRNSAALQLSEAGNVVQEQINLARQTAMAKRTQSGVIIPTSGSFGYQALAVFTQDFQTGAWVQTSQWKKLPDSIYFVDPPSSAYPSPPDISSLESINSTLPAGFPFLQISGQAVPSAVFINFDERGDPIQTESPMIVRVAAGQKTGNTVVTTEQAGTKNYFDLLVLTGFPGVKIIRP